MGSLLTAVRAHTTPQLVTSIALPARTLAVDVGPQNSVLLASHWREKLVRDGS